MEVISLQSVTCDGIITNFRSIQSELIAYTLNCASATDADYDIAIVNKFYIVRAMGCTGVGLPVKQNGGHLHCTACTELRKSQSGKRPSKIKQTIVNRSDKIINIEQLLLRSEMSERDYMDMNNFLKTPDSTLSSRGTQLKSKVQLYKDYYDQMKRCTARSQNSNGLIPSGDTFCNQFMGMYQDKTHRESLLFCLMRAYVAKAHGHKNPEVGSKVS